MNVEKLRWIENTNEKVTKMYHKALEDKLAKMKQGMITRDSWYADTVKQLGFTYDRI